MNAATLLLEAGANPNALSEHLKTPLQLCENDPPIKALLTGSRSSDVSDKNQVLYAAKELLTSTLTPVASFEETIILSCQKAIDDASNCKPTESTEYRDIQASLKTHLEVISQFKAVIQRVTVIKSSLESRRKM